MYVSSSQARSDWVAHEMTGPGGSETRTVGRTTALDEKVELILFEYFSVRIPYKS